MFLFYLIRSQLEGSLSQWTSYQEDVHQFVGWVEHVEENLDSTDKQCPEMRDKTANLSKAKVLPSSQPYTIVAYMRFSILINFTQLIGDVTHPSCYFSCCMRKCSVTTPCWTPSRQKVPVWLRTMSLNWSSKIYKSAITQPETMPW